MQKNKIRLTSARKAILDELAESQTHLTAAQLHTRLVERLPSLNLTTVYRSLEYLVEKNLISVSDMGIGSPVYEIMTDEPHHHLVCIDCRVVLKLEPGLVTPFFTAVEEKTQVSLRTNHLVLFGICPHCKEEE